MKGRSKPNPAIFTEQFKKQSRFAPIENVDVCNPIGVLPNMTKEEAEEKTKDMLTIFQDFKKKKNKQSGIDNFTSEDIELELKKMKYQAKRMDGESNIRWYLNKTTKDPIQEQIATLGYYKAPPRRNANLSGTALTQAASKLTSPKGQVLAENEMDAIERLIQSSNMFDSKSR